MTPEVTSGHWLLDLLFEEVLMQEKITKNGYSNIYRSTSSQECSTYYSHTAVWCVTGLLDLPTEGQLAKHTKLNNYDIMTNTPTLHIFL